MSKTVFKILIAAGGSGGHLFPARQLASQLGGHEVMIAGHNLSKNPFFQGQFRFQDIEASMPKKGNLFRFFLATCKGFFQSILLLRRFSPDIVVGFGSYHTFPILLGSLLLRKKIVLFEANCILGKVNRLFAPFAKKIAVQFPLHQAAKKTVFVPLLPWGKKDLENIKITKEEAASYFGLSPSKFTVLIFGGSQGASFFNEVMPKVLSFFPDCQAIHFTGKGKAVYPNGNGCVKEFEERMDLAYSAADIVVCRSGAGTLGELIRYKKPSLLIPFPYAADQHQLINAFFLTNIVGGSRLLEQKNGSLEKIVDEIKFLRKNFPHFQLALENWKMGDRIDLAEVCLEA